MVWTPLPEAFVTSIKKEISGPWIDTFWKGSVLILLAALVYTLATLGIVGGVIAFIIVSSLASDWVRDVISDLWNRNLWSA